MAAVGFIPWYKRVCDDRVAERRLKIFATILVFNRRSATSVY